MAELRFEIEDKLIIVFRTAQATAVCNELCEADCAS